MLRYLLTAASVFALCSSVALAEPVDGTKTVTIQKSPYGKTVTKRFMNHRGMLVTKSKTFHDGFSGSSVTRSKTITDPEAGGTVTRSRTIIER
ncbi:MAG TPA: hypothetical protein VK554_03540 [Bradyrhizobium sp.]|nr:hypothetical protein [Bradyrhizobium sp.]